MNQSPLRHLFLMEIDIGLTVRYEQILRELQVNRWTPEIQDRIRQVSPRKNEGKSGSKGHDVF